MIHLPQCCKCVHLSPKEGEIVCKAFPEGIPEEIWHNRIDHIKPCDGDHGIYFKARDNASPRNDCPCPTCQQ